MHFTYKLVKNIPVLNFNQESGSLIGHNIDATGEGIVGLMTDGVHRVVIDLTKKNYLNSFGLGELINIRSFLISKGVTCTLIVNSKKISKLLDMVGVSELFDIIASEEEI